MKQWQRFLLLAAAVSGVIVIIEQSISDTFTTRIGKISYIIQSIHSSSSDYDYNANDSTHVCETIQRVQNVSITVNGHWISMPKNDRSEPEHLDVFVVLHSHVDPGWLETFDSYYNSKVHNILNNVLNALEEFEDMKFIWIEACFLDKWWSRADESNRNRMRRLIQGGRLEVAGGSWVMTDEATPYFWSSIDQMVTGHQFILNNFNVTPKSSWSVDPFGHGSMMPYLNSLSGIDRMVIGRIGGHLKHEMRQAHHLNFRWVQPWDTDMEWAPTVNVLPNTYYTISSAFGVDEQINCLFDVAVSSRAHCGNGNEKADDKPGNIVKYAEMMLNQFRSLQNYYNLPSLLISAGDDFAYSDPNDLRTVHRIYSALFSYINSHPEHKMKVRFGTVSDFFNSLEEISFPSLSGDFFPYIDIPNADDYWTGFYNHMPYHKRLERITHAKIRALDLLSVAAKAHKMSQAHELARQQLALFQHHDAITATSKPLVMLDYFNRLKFSVNTTLLEQESYLSQLQDISHVESISSVDSPPSNKTYELLPQKVLKFDDQNEQLFVTVYNQNSYLSRQLITVQTNTPNVSVVWAEWPIDAQIGPLLTPDGIHQSLLTLSFFVTLDAFVVAEIELKSHSTLPFSTQLSTIFCNEECRNISHFPTRSMNGTATLENPIYSFSLDARNNGNDILKLRDMEEELELNIDFTEELDEGGAYTVFNLNKGYDVYGGARTLEKSQRLQRKNATKTYMVVGDVYSTYYQQLSTAIAYALTMTHETSVSSRCLHLQVWSNATQLRDTSVFLSVNTSIDNERIFYTDVNGMHLTQRSVNESNFARHWMDSADDSDFKYEDGTGKGTKESEKEAKKASLYSVNEMKFKKQYRLEANLFPMSSEAMVEDNRLRLTVLGGQTTGVTSMKSGSLDLMVDRRMTGDDGKGLSAGDASESYPSELVYRIVVEKRRIALGKTPTLYHSSTVQRLLDQLLYPPTLFVRSPQHSEVPVPVKSLFKSLPCDIQLINARYISDNFVLVILRRLPYSCDVLSNLSQCETDPDLIRVFFESLGSSIFEMNLTGTSRGAQLNVDDVIQRLSAALRIRSFGVELR